MASAAANNSSSAAYDAAETGGLLRRRNTTAAARGNAGEEEEEAEAVAPSVEQAFADKPVPSWREQLTVRAFVVGFLLSIMFNIIVMKLSLTTGVIPSLNVSASLLGFFLVRLWTAAIERVGFLKQPFTRQENTVIQTCVVSAYGVAFSGKRSNSISYSCSTSVAPDQVVFVHSVVWEDLGFSLFRDLFWDILLYRKIDLLKKDISNMCLCSGLCDDRSRVIA